MDVEKVPSIGISYTVELPGKKALVLQSFIDRDCKSADLDSILDKVRVAADRQFSFGMLEVLKLELEQQERIANDHMARMTDLDIRLKDDWNKRGKRGDPTLSSREQEEQRKAHLHMEECKKRVAKVKAEITEHEKKCGLAGA